MADGNPACRGADTHIAGRVIHRIFDISVFKEILQLFNGGNRTVVLRLSGRSSQMRRNNDIFYSRNRRVGKIRHVTLYLARVQCLDHSLFIDQNVSCIVQNYHSVLHHLNGFPADHSPGAVCQRNVDSNKITIPINVIDVLNMMNGAGKIPGSVYGNKRIIAIDIHPKVCRRVGHLLSDGAKADNSQLFPADFAAGELLFLFFRQFSHIRIILLAVYPLDASDNISGGKKHSCQNQLLDTVGICSGCIKNNNSLIRTAVKRNVIDSGTRAADCQELARQFHIQHFCAADQYRVRLIKIIRLSVILSEAVQSDRCNRIQAMILKHNQLFSFSNLSINSTSF